jgi:hypothetical protein
LGDDEISIPDEYIDFCVIREMGWDWWTYEMQPDFFIEQIFAFMSAEKKAKRKD